VGDQLVCRRVFGSEAAQVEEPVDREPAEHEEGGGEEGEEAEDGKCQDPDYTNQWSKPYISRRHLAYGV
jgi:hypothetical protein